MSTKFDVRQALRNLDIEIKPFGYCGHGMPDLVLGDRKTLRGYSSDRWLAVNPNERWPEVVTFHETAHILRGDTTVYKDYGIDFSKLLVKEPTFQEKINFERFADYKEKYHDIIEAECHATAIFTALMTDTLMDMKAELSQLIHCYSHGRDLPDDMMDRAFINARKIEKAGMVSKKKVWTSAA